MSFQLKLCRLEVTYYLKLLMNTYIFNVHTHGLFDFCLVCSKNRLLGNSTGIFIRIHYHQMLPVFQKPKNTWKRVASYLKKGS